MARFDLDSTRTDLVINDNLGDFDAVESDQAHIEHIVDAAKGDFKEFPLTGIRSNRFLNAAGGTQAAKREIFVGLKADGYGSIVIESVEDSFTIDAIPLT